MQVFFGSLDIKGLSTSSRMYNYAYNGINNDTYDLISLQYTYKEILPHISHFLDQMMMKKSLIQKKRDNGKPI